MSKNESKKEKIYEGEAYYGYNDCQSFAYFGVKDEKGEPLIEDDNYMGQWLPDELKEFLKKNKGKKVRFTMKLEKMNEGE